MFGGFHPFDDAIPGAGHDPQPPAEPVDGLVVKGIDLQRGGAHQPGEARRSGEGNAMGLGVAFSGAGMIERAPRVGGNILVQRPPERDIQELLATADGQDGAPGLERASDESQFHGVATPGDAPGRGVARLAVVFRINITPARQQQTVNPGSQLPVAPREEQDREAARLPDRPDESGPGPGLPIA